MIPAFAVGPQLRLASRPRIAIATQENPSANEPSVVNSQRIPFQRPLFTVVVLMFSADAADTARRATIVAPRAVTRGATPDICREYSPTLDVHLVGFPRLRAPSARCRVEPRAASFAPGQPLKPFGRLADARSVDAPQDRSARRRPDPSRIPHPALLVFPGLVLLVLALWFLTNDEALWGSFFLTLAVALVPMSMNIAAMRRRAAVWQRGEVPRPHVTEPIIWVEIALIALVTAAFFAIGVRARGDNDQLVEIGSFGLAAYSFFLLMLYLGSQVVVAVVRRRERA